MIDGGPGAAPTGRLNAWLLTDEPAADSHIGRPTIRARDVGEEPPFGEFGDDGRAFRIRV